MSLPRVVTRMTSPLITKFTYFPVFFCPLLPYPSLLETDINLMLPSLLFFCSVFFFPFHRTFFPHVQKRWVRPLRTVRFTICTSPRCPDKFFSSPFFPPPPPLCLNPLAPPFSRVPRLPNSNNFNVGSFSRKLPFRAVFLFSPLLQFSFFSVVTPLKTLCNNL